MNNASPSSPPPPASATSAAGRIEALGKIKAALGDSGWSEDAQITEPYLNDFLGFYQGRCALLARPATTEQVAEIISLCAGAGIPVVPQGGNTGLCGGATPHESGEEVLISLDRMDQIRTVDPLNYTITVDAGCILANVQAAADDADRLFPLSLGAEGSCRIGGNLSTNAGGVNVLRYGSARDLVLGLEVVLPDGRVWDGLRGLRKDNTGYDLKHLFIGGEGTLGIITGAVLKLFPKPEDIQTCVAALPRREDIVELLARARRTSGDSVTSFEYMPRLLIDLNLRHLNDAIDPLDEKHEHYALIEFSGALREKGGLGGAMERFLAEAFEDGLVADATIAQSEGQRRSFWGIREGVVESGKAEGGRIGHDVSVPVSDVPVFLSRTETLLGERFPGARICGFGHAGDGNIHYSVFAPEGTDGKAFQINKDAVNAIVFSVIAECGGSISAEHGIGRLKREQLPRYKTELELEMMRRLKQAIDPQCIMNPGKVV